MNKRTIKLLDELYARNERAIESVVDGLRRDVSGSCPKGIRGDLETVTSGPRLRYLPPEGEADLHQSEKVDNGEEAESSCCFDGQRQ